MPYPWECKTRILQLPFDLRTHKKNFTNYLEVIILPNGTINYAVPSHQEKLIQIAMEQLSISRDQLSAAVPEDYYFDLIEWLCLVTKCVSVWNDRWIGEPNERQEEVIKMLVEEKLLNLSFSDTCGISNKSYLKKGLFKNENRETCCPSDQ